MKTVQPKFRYIQLLLAFLLSIFLLNLKSFPTQTKLLASLPSEPLLNPLKVSSPQHQQLIPTFSPTSTLYISPSQTPAPASLAPSSQPILPSEHIIPIQGHRQRFSIDCEASAAVDWAAYYGVTIDEFEFQSKIPKSDNPDYGFVGSVNGDWGQVPPAAYGVYAQPIANLLVSYGLPAYAVRNASLELIKNQISHNNPVLVWVVGRMEKSKPIFYTDKERHKTIVTPYEHVVILRGFDNSTQHLLFMSEGKFYQVNYTTFLDSWKILGCMAVIRK